MKSIQPLLDSIIEIREKYLIERHERGLDYNVFKVIRKSDDEVNLHTKIIENLLNPNSFHGINKEPLLLFIDLCIPKLNKIDFINNNIVVKREHQTAYGNIDILISTKNTIIAIENKINAEDQYKQLERYFDYLKSTSKKGFLMYLTTDGRAATEKCIDPNKKQIYIKISYHYHIIKWIERILKINTIKSFVSEPLKQYLNIVKEITGVSMIDKEDKEITTIIRKNRKNYDAALQVHNKFVLIKEEIENEIKLKLEQGMEDIKKKYNLFPDKDEDGNTYICHDRKLKIKFGIWWDGRNIYYGVTTTNKEDYKKLKKLYPDQDKHGDDAYLISYDTNFSFDDDLFFEKYIENENILKDVIDDLETFMNIFIAYD